MKITELKLRTMIREEIMNETYGGSTLPTEKIEFLYKKFADWVVNSHVDPKTLIRQLSYDLLGVEKKRRPRFVNDITYKDLFVNILSLGRYAQKSLQIIGEFFEKDDPTSQENIDRKFKFYK